MVWKHPAKNKKKQQKKQQKKKMLWQWKKEHS